MILILYSLWNELLRVQTLTKFIQCIFFSPSGLHIPIHIQFHDRFFFFFPSEKHYEQFSGLAEMQGHHRDQFPLRQAVQPWHLWLPILQQPALASPSQANNQRGISTSGGLWKVNTNLQPSTFLSPLPLLTVEQWEKRTAEGLPATPALSDFTLNTITWEYTKFTQLPATSLTLAGKQLT